MRVWRDDVGPETVHQNSTKVSDIVPDLRGPQTGLKIPPENTSRLLQSARASPSAFPTHPLPWAGEDSRPRQAAEGHVRVVQSGKEKHRLM